MKAPLEYCFFAKNILGHTCARAHTYAHTSFNTHIHNCFNTFLFQNKGSLSACSRRQTPKPFFEY